ncbi:MAG: VWA domain-containing protein [Ignavibacteria bacterium]|nr:VWA domain-containing protein [Ignavibacteria bacterium]
MINRFKYAILILLSIVFIGSCTFDDPNLNETTDSGLTPNPQPNPTTSAPNNPSPSDGAINQLLFVTLSWQSDNAVDFDVYLGELNPPLIKYTTTTSKSYLTPPLKYDTKYYWRIVARFADGSLKAGPVWSFTTLPATFPTANGFALIHHKTSINLPNVVESIVQVLDLNGEGVDFLKQTDFEIFENDLPLSIAESGLTITRTPIVPFTIKTVLLLDNSTSLQSDLTKIKNSAVTIVNGLRPTQEFAVYQFSDKQYLIHDFSQNINSLTNAINTQFVMGVKSTDFYGSIKFGASLWEDDLKLPKFIQGCLVAISDGEDTQGSTSLADGLHSVHNKLSYTVGLGSTIQPEIIRAFGTGGTFKIGEEQNIINRFVELEKSIQKKASSFYTITYNSPKRGDRNHNLKIRIKNNLYSGEKSFVITSFNSAGFF